MKNLAATQDVATAREHLSTDFQSLVSHAEELLQATTSLSNEGVNAARQKLSQSLQQVRSEILPVRDAAIERARLAATTATTYARENPWQAAAVVVLAALALGFVTNLGRSSK